MTMFPEWLWLLQVSLIVSKLVDRCRGKHDCFYSEAEFQQMFPIPVSVRSTHVEIDEDILDLGNGLRKLRCTNRGGRIRHVLSACRDR